MHVVWAPAGTTYHQKTLTVDGATSVIMTLNLVTEDYPGTRDFAVIDTGHSDVAAIAATFDADFSGHAVHPTDGADLVWSPTNAEASVLAVIRVPGIRWAWRTRKWTTPRSPRPWVPPRAAG